MQILNPALFNALKTRFGDVKVSNPGEKYVGKLTRDPYNLERVKTECVYPGEYYAICCPYCKDDRFRLWVNHRWNTLDEKGRPFGRHLIICYNERCDMGQFHKELLFFMNNRPKLGSCIATGAAAAMFKPAALPGVCVPINTLEPNHPAIRYLLRDRVNPLGYPVSLDPHALFNDWRVHFCVSAETGKGYAPDLVQNRIIIPIFKDSQMVGWQARPTNNFDVPKYYTMPGLHKSSWLFNGDRAKNYPIGVIVEGVFDAFAVGRCAVALLGKSISPQQQRLLMSWFGERIVCFLLDPDAVGEMRKGIDSLKHCFRGGCFGVTLADGWDAGACTNQRLWQIIREEGQRQGIKIPV